MGSSVTATSTARLKSAQDGLHCSLLGGTALAMAEHMTLPHHSLLAWKRADDLFIDLHLLSRTFPPLEKYELGSQLRRSAFSVPVNIVESCSRFTDADKLHFLQVASASLAEVGYCLHAARRLGYIADKEYQRFELQIRKAAAPLRGLMKSLGREHP